MENKKTVWSYLFTPFRYVAGIQSLLTGIAVLLLLSLLGYLTHTFFDGVLDVHYGCLSEPSLYPTHLSLLAISWVSVTLVLYVAARIYSSSSVRIVDMAGTLALAKAPLVIPALYGFVPSIHLCMGDINTKDIQAMQAMLIDKIGPIMIMALLSIVILIWYVVLMYNAFSVSGNLKGSKGGWIFAIGLLVSEVLSKVLIYFVL